MRSHPRKPDYYLYQKDGIWFKTDDALTKLISAHIFGLKAVQLPKMVFYPNWDKNEAQGAKYVAWRVNSFGEQVVRWYWKVGEHNKKKCGDRCKRLEDGRCAIKCPCSIEWNDAAKCWQLSKMQYKASEAEAKILDNA